MKIVGESENYLRWLSFLLWFFSPSFLLEAQCELPSGWPGLFAPKILRKVSTSVKVKHILLVNNRWTIQYNSKIHQRDYWMSHVKVDSKGSCIRWHTVHMFVSRITEINITQRYIPSTWYKTPHGTVGGGGGSGAGVDGLFKLLYLSFVK